MGDLVQGMDCGEMLIPDRQLAIVFERQRYPEYARAAIKILHGLPEELSELSRNGVNVRILEQIGETIEDLSRPRWYARPVAWLKRRTGNRSK